MMIIAWNQIAYIEKNEVRKPRFILVADDVITWNKRKYISKLYTR